MKTILKTSFVLMLLLMASCTTTDKEKAMAYLTEARYAAENGNDSIAVALIDSIDIKYPKEIEIRRQGDTLMWQIDYKRLSAILPVINSEIDSLNELIPNLAKDFKFLKNEYYQDFGIFEPKTLLLENNTGRCFLKVTTDEHGKAEIISNYTGTKASHNTITISVDSVSVSTGVIKEENISAFNYDDIYKELIIIDENTSKNILLFVYQNQDNKIKVTLSGDNTQYHYYLTKTERTAFAKTHLLSQALSQLVKLVDAQTKTDQKTEYLKTKLNY